MNSLHFSSHSDVQMFHFFSFFFVFFCACTEENEFNEFEWEQIRKRFCINVILMKSSHAYTFFFGEETLNFLNNGTTSQHAYTFVSSTCKYFKLMVKLLLLMWRNKQICTHHQALNVQRVNVWVSKKRNPKFLVKELKFSLGCHEVVEIRVIYNKKDKKLNYNCEAHLIFYHLKNCQLSDIYQVIAPFMDACTHVI